MYYLWQAEIGPYGFCHNLVFVEPIDRPYRLN